MIRAGHPQPVLIAGGSAAALSDVVGDAAIGIGRHGGSCSACDCRATGRSCCTPTGSSRAGPAPGPSGSAKPGLHRLIAEWTAAQPDWREHPEALLDELIAGAERLNGGALSDDVAMLLLGAHRREERA